MTLQGKNKYLFSYKNDNRRERTFQYKDFEKTQSYNTDFSYSKFIGSSFRAAKMKYCNFSDCLFESDDFVGTNMGGSKFVRASFSNCIFVETLLDNANFKSTRFMNCYFVGTQTKMIENYAVDKDGIIKFDSMPDQNLLNPKLVETIEQLRSNDIIRRSHTLHCKKNRVNTLTITILEKEYTDEELINFLPLLPQLAITQFYTVSYLQMLLKKAKELYIIKMPRHPSQEIQS